MSLLAQRRRQLAESLLGTTDPAGPQMEPEVGFWQAWRENAAKRLGTLGSLADPMTWYRAIGSLPPPDSEEARKLFRSGGQGLLDIAMDWGVNPIAGGLLGTFKGINANLSPAETEMLQKAFELEQQGLGREAIRQETNPPGGSGGWFRAPWDQKWRMEIDDSRALVNASGPEGARVSNDIPLGVDPSLDIGPGGLLEHPELFAAYDKNALAAHTYISPSRTMLGSDRGSYNPTERSVTYFAPQTAEQARSTALHEVGGHGAQGIEGFARGGSPDMAFRDPRIYGTGAEGSDVARRMLAEKMAEISKPLSLEDYAKRAWNSDKVTDEIRSAYKKEYLPSVKNISPEMEREIQKEVAQRWYRSLAGEAEARLIEARRDLTPQQRSLLDPIEQMDTMLKQEGILGGINDLIVRYGY